MNMPEEFVDMVDNDIARISEALEANGTGDLWPLFREMIGKYDSCIENFYKNMFGSNMEGNYLHTALMGKPDDVKYNLQLISAKLMTFRYGMNAVQRPAAPSTNVNVTTNVNLNLTFEEARSAVEDMTALTDDQTQEILSRIDEIEQTTKGSGSKKSKWEKIKPTLRWLADQSLDIAKIVLPLLLK